MRQAPQALNCCLEDLGWAEGLRGYGEEAALWAGDIVYGMDDGVERSFYIFLGRMKRIYSLNLDPHCLCLFISKTDEICPMCLYNLQPVRVILNHPIIQPNIPARTNARRSSPAVRCSLFSFRSRDIFSKSFPYFETSRSRYPTSPFDACLAPAPVIDADSVVLFVPFNVDSFSRSAQSKKSVSARGSKDGSKSKFSNGRRNQK
jgi:hypothetical protein